MKGLFSILLFSVISFIFGCRGEKGDSGPTGPGGLTGPQGPQLIGNLVGTVRLFDERGNQIFNNSGVIVRIARDTIQTQTDTTGRWEFKSLKTGLYTIIFDKLSYGVYKQMNFQFIGGGTVFLSLVSLYQLPSFDVTGAGINGLASPQDTLKCYAKVSAGEYSLGETRFVRWFLIRNKKDSNVNTGDSLFFANGVPYIFSALTSSASDSFAMRTPLSVLYQSGAKSGDRISAIACPISSSLSFPDTATGLEVYPFIKKPFAIPGTGLP
jgi:hypothetical protein